VDLDVPALLELLLARVVAGVRPDPVRVVTAGLAEVLHVDPDQRPVVGLAEDRPGGAVGRAQDREDRRHMDVALCRGTVIGVLAAAEVFAASSWTMPASS